LEFRQVKPSGSDSAETVGRDRGCQPGRAIIRSIDCELQRVNLSAR
jgi:hypothetical protein